MKISSITMAAGLLFIVLINTSGFATNIDTVGVGNSGNASDEDFGFGGAFGSVSVPYRIGTFEVTNQQYTDFLNAVAGIDDHGLYNEQMGLDTRGGITRAPSDTGFRYSTRPNMGDKPVNYVSLWDAARFSNWLHNGTPTGLQSTSTTEDGAYSLDGIASPEFVLARNTDATWFLPSEDEWYKAAYHQPFADGGDEDNYWLHAGRNNRAPSRATVDDAGNILHGNLRSVANYGLLADWNGVDGNVSTVGSAGDRNASFYGTFDQAGNVEEWTEGLHVDEFGRFQVFRGGSFATPAAGNLGAAFRNITAPSAEAAVLGFRIATVPEPSGAIYGWFILIVLLDTRRRRNSSRNVALR